MHLAIGIDLGTSYSSVGVFRNDGFEIIPNEEGGLTTPSVVAFTDTGRLIGNPAKNQLVRNPQNTIFDAQRLIGREFADSEVQADMKHFPFKVIDKYGRPAIEVLYKGETKVFIPEEIISMVLFKLKEMAESYIGGCVDSAVITVPPLWDSSKRESLRVAGSLAGLCVPRIVASTTCAVLAYALDRKDEEGERNSLVFDLGGGTCGVSLATIEGGIVAVHSVGSDIHLGGEDFTSCLVNHFVNHFKRRQGKDITANSRSLCRLRSACEHAKCTLSSATMTPINIENLFEGIDFNTSVSITKFEELCQDLFLSTTWPLERVLADSKIQKTKIHDIILIGGSSRIPRIQKTVTDFFDGKKPITPLNPDQAACHGAAILAALQSDDIIPEALRETFLIDVQPISLGIGTIGGQMTKLIPRSTNIPTKKSLIFSSADRIYDGESKLPICVLPICFYEGERARAKDNNLLGKISPPNVSSSSRALRIEVSIDVNFDKIEVAVFDQITRTHSRSNLTKTRFSKEEIEDMIVKAEKYNAEDRAEATRVSAKNVLESQLYNVRSAIKDPKLSRWIEPSENKRLEGNVDDLLTWLEQHEFATTDAYESQLKELEVLVNQVKTGVEARDRKSSLEDDLFSSQTTTTGDAPSNCATSPDLALGAHIETPRYPHRSAEQSLSKFFSSINVDTRKKYKDIELQEISGLLKDIGYESWSKVPRLYTLLRLIGQLQLLDSFIDRGITDRWFPFTKKYLPAMLTSSMLSDFEKTQSLVLTDLSELETDAGRDYAGFNTVPGMHRFALFDEQSPSLGADELSEQWFWRYRNIFKVIPETPEKDDRVKIAILDSGIDLNENYIVMNRDRIKYRSFVSGEEGIEDLIGHGTHTAALLLKVAPNSNIFVARITASGNLEDTACIESAIRHAIQEWKVDIITMSFGFPFLDEYLDGIQTAINEAFVSKILMFAAAKNDGANSGIAYPANQDQVICVNSTDGQGNPSKYNPSPVIGRNLSVLGEDVLSSWPLHFRIGMQRKSGTSYATPIAAGIAAVVLDYARQKMQPNDRYAISKLRTPKGMQAVLSLMCKDRGGYRYLAPWEFFNEDKLNIYWAILDILKKV